MMGRQKRMGLLGAVTLVIALMLTPAMAAAAPAPATPTNSVDVCTDFEKLGQNVNGGADGILSNIIGFIKPVVGEASRSLFQAFTTSDSYQLAVNAAITLMVVIYGVGFTIGVVQPSFGQAFMRLFKVGLIFALISSDGWTFFSETVVAFFNDGTDELIAGVMKIGTGIEVPPGGSPFAALDSIARIVLSPDMIIAIIGATFGSGPFGLAVGGLLAFAVTGLLKLLLQGLKTYAVSFIVRALLLGVAPIFIVFLLFDKTKQMFIGWLNSLVSLSLKPILYFTFISFFIVMMQDASKSMLGGAELCWTAASTAQGTPNKISKWTFKLPGSNAPITQEMTWKGPIMCPITGEGKLANGACPEFPINILDVLSFLILVYVAQRFASIIDRLANDIASVSINLSVDTRLALPGSSDGRPAAGAVTNQGHANTPPPKAVDKPKR